MRIILGADEHGFLLMNEIYDFLKASKMDVEMLSPADGIGRDYPDIGNAIAIMVRRGTYDRAILCCATGAGMAIVANKVTGVRAVCVSDRVTAERAITRNDARVITLGGELLDSTIAKELVAIWLAHEFQGGNSSRKVARIVELEQVGDDNYTSP